MQTRTKIALAATALMLLGGTVAATSATADSRHQFHRSGHSGHMGHGGHMGMERLFERLDSDGDGKITRAEVEATRGASFAAHDKNGDGVLNLEEFQGLWLERMRERMVDSFQRLDDDGDAAVTKEEFDRRFNRLFSRLDRDNDGSIARDETEFRPHHRRSAD